jgi:transposase-like protein
MPRKSSSAKPKAVVRAGARRTHDDAFKFKAALEAYGGAVPLSELASKYEVHPNLISQWKVKWFGFPDSFSQAFKVIPVFT